MNQENENKSKEFDCIIDYETGKLYGLSKNSLKDFCKEIGQSAVRVIIIPR